MTKKSYEFIADNVDEVKHRIEQAAQKSGRKGEDITLVGVTKTQSAKAVRALIEAGVHSIGENKVQEILEKEAEIEDLPHTMHMIGHLQSNKAKFLPCRVDFVQSVDSEKIAMALEREFAKEKQNIDVLIQVNIGDESTKNGISPLGVLPLAEALNKCKHLRLCGLMAIPPICTSDQARAYFEQMRHLFVDICDEKMDNISMGVLSMGMSQDYENAILEGSTMVRVGTALFGPRG